MSIILVKANGVSVCLDPGKHSYYSNPSAIQPEYYMQVGLLNVEGYYNSLLSFIDKAVDEGFISPTARRIIVSAPTAKQLVRELEVLYTPSQIHNILSHIIFWPQNIFKYSPKYNLEFLKTSLCWNLCTHSWALQCTTFLW